MDGLTVLGWIDNFAQSQYSVELTAILNREQLNLPLLPQVPSFKMRRYLHLLYR